ncbi:hypothetical protein JW707_01695 [Candidatus Woesearchaeota archaeon]|nr:hypothetical protein [Candidatus Woesearchaeota archaeon]
MDKRDALQMYAKQLPANAIEIMEKTFTNVEEYLEIIPFGYCYDRIGLIESVLFYRRCLRTDEHSLSNYAWHYLNVLGNAAKEGKVSKKKALEFIKTLQLMGGTSERENKLLEERIDNLMGVERHEGRIEKRLRKIGSHDIKGMIALAAEEIAEEWQKYTDPTGEKASVLGQSAMGEGYGDRLSEAYKNLLGKPKPLEGPLAELASRHIPPEMREQTALSIREGLVDDTKLETIMVLMFAGHIPSKDVISMLEKRMDQDESVDRDTFEQLAHAIPSGRVDAADVLRLYYKGISDVSEFRFQYQYARNALPALADVMRSGKITPEDVRKLFKATFDTYRPDHEGEHNLMNQPDDLLPVYAKVVDASNNGLEDLLWLFERMIPYSKDSVGAVSHLGELNRFVLNKRLNPKRLVHLYEMGIVEDHYVVAGCVAQELQNLLELEKHGLVNLDDILRLYDLAFQCNGIKGAAGGLQSLAEMHPEHALTRLYKLNETITQFVVIKDSDDLHDRWALAADIARSFGEFILTYRGDFYKEFVDLALAFAVESYRLEKMRNIHQETNRPHRPTNEEKINDFVMGNYLDLKPYERDELIAILTKTPYRFAEEHEKLNMPGGWTSKAILDMADDVVKVATIEQNRGEERVYLLKPKLEVFGNFMAEQRGQIVDLDDGNSLLVVGNLKKRKPAWVYATELYEKLGHGEKSPWFTKHRGYNEAMFNMFLLGFAHKELTQAVHKGAADFPNIKYSPKDGGLHVDAIKRPLPATSIKVYREHMMPVPGRLIEESRKRVKAFRDYADSHSSKSVILGDNKIRENSINGYMYDFAMTGWGLEIEDIIYGLTEPGMGFCSEDKPVDRNLIRHFVSEYIMMRCMHDEKFVSDVLRGKDREMLAVTDDAILHALSVYASCTRKRVQQMENGSIIPRRNYFIRAMQYMLDNGEFATSN